MGTHFVQEAKVSASRSSRFSKPYFSLTALNFFNEIERKDKQIDKNIYEKKNLNPSLPRDDIGTTFGMPAGILCSLAALRLS